MDTKRPISYRGLALNDAALASGRISGITVDRVEYGSIPAVGYIEKRSNSDGYDAGDVFLGKRDLTLWGTVYADTRAALFDKKQALMAAFSPTGAYAESPADYGYLPLAFEEPTLDTDNFPAGYIPKMLRVRANATPTFNVVRDAIGGADSKALAIPFSVPLEARDPRIYHQTSIAHYPDDTGVASSGTLEMDNRGDYPTPVRIVFYAAASEPAIRLTLVGLGTSMVLDIPDDSVERILRYDGHEKYVTLEKNGLEVLRMDLMTIAADTVHPQVPAGEGHELAWTHTNDADVARAVDPRTVVFYWEAWA